MTWNELKAVLASGDHWYDPDLLERSPLGLKKYAGIARDKRRKGNFLGSGRTRDAAPNTALTYRMGVGFPGTVNRLHPASIEPVLIDATAPPLYYGQAVVVDATTQGVRPLAAGDLTAGAFDPFGITVRPFPIQQTTGGLTAALYSGTPPVSGVIDVLKFGYIIIQFNASGSAPVKGAQPYAWAAATSGAHTQGLWETAAGTPGTNTVLIGSIPRTVYQGGWDANNIGELIFHA